jgi:hypothetical protein
LLSLVNMQLPHVGGLGDQCILRARLALI